MQTTADQYNKILRCPIERHHLRGDQVYTVTIPLRFPCQPAADDDTKISFDFYVSRFSNRPCPPAVAALGLDRRADLPERAGLPAVAVSRSQRFPDTLEGETLQYWLDCVRGPPGRKVDLDDCIRSARHTLTPDRVRAVRDALRAGSAPSEAARELSNAIDGLESLSKTCGSDDGVDQVLSAVESTVFVNRTSMIMHLLIIAFEHDMNESAGAA